MAWYPEAIRKEIPPGSNDPRIIPVGLVYHVRAGIGDSLFGYFDGPSGGIESTWYIRFDGTVEQYRDSDFEADANGSGNSWVVDGKRYGLHSVETEGREHGLWTPEQITSLKYLTVWDARAHDWPLQLCPDWNGPGVGYHVMFGAPGPWTNVAKTCPGPDRVRQFHEIFRPWLAAGAPMEDDDMPYTEDEITQFAANGVLRALRDSPIAKKVFDDRVGSVVEARLTAKRGEYTHTGNRITIANIGAHNYAWLAYKQAVAANARADAILKAVSAIPGVDGEELARQVAAEIEKIAAEDVVDAIGERLAGDGE